MSSTREFAIRTFLAVLGLVLALVVVEIGFRLYFSGSASAVEQANKNYRIEVLSDSNRGYGNRPGWEKSNINSLGFRGPEFSIEKPAGVTRILMLGDSITFGDGVEYNQTVAHYLAQYLNSRSGDRRFEVLNLGVDGYNTEQELATLREVGLRLAPDIVVLNICLNDSDPVKLVMASGLLNISAKISRPSDINIRTIVGSSYALTFLKDRILQLVIAPLAPSLISTLNDPRYLINRRVSETAWSEMKEKMLDIARLSAGGHAGFLAVVYPYSSQFRIAPEELLPQRDLLDFFRAQGITALDVMPAMAPGGVGMFADSVHLSPAGAERVARAIEGTLAESLNLSASADN